jgi:hypothetical protein
VHFQLQFIPLLVLERCSEMFWTPEYLGIEKAYAKDLIPVGSQISVWWSDIGWE